METLLKAFNVVVDALFAKLPASAALRQVTAALDAYESAFDEAAGCHFWHRLEDCMISLQLDLPVSQLEHGELGEIGVESLRLRL